MIPLMSTDFHKSYTFIKTYINLSVENGWWDLVAPLKSIERKHFFTYQRVASSSTISSYKFDDTKEFIFKLSEFITDVESVITHQKSFVSLIANQMDKVEMVFTRFKREMNLSKLDLEI